MNPLLKVFANIALLRRGPEDLPASAFLLLLSALVYALGSAATSAVFTHRPAQIFLEVLADIVLMLLWYGALLAVYRRRARLPQTLTALFGTGSLLYLIAFPVMSWLHLQAGSPTGLQLPTLLMMVILIWSIAVAAHIVHRALEIPMTVAILIGITYFITSVLIFVLLFGTNA